MIGRTLLTAFVIAAVSMITTTAEANPPAGTIDSLLASWNREDAPGVAVLVQHHGRDVYKHCYGSASLEHALPITPETVFDLASVSKHLTAFSVLLLEKSGQIRLDDDIRRYLPELPDFCTQVKVSDLLYQSSGLWEFWSILNQYSGFEARDYFSTDDVLRLISHQKEPTFPPGTKYSYSNTNYALLSVIVARVTGESFGDWTSANVFGPLGMTATHFQEDCTEIIPLVASAYERRGGMMHSARPMNVDIPGSAHAFTNLNDMSRWLDNFRTRKLGGEEVFSRMFTGGVLRNGDTIDYTAGLMAGEFRGVRVLQHSGQTGGYKTMIVYCPDEELGVVVMANERSISAYRLSHDILGLFVPEVEDEEREGAIAQISRTTPIRLDQQALERFAGGYLLDPDSQLAGIYCDADLLVMSLKGGRKDYFFPISETEFEAYTGPLAVAFEVDAEGNVLSARVTVDGVVNTAIRIEDDRKAARTPDDKAGEYCSEALASVCEILVRDGQVLLSHRRYGEIPLHWVASDQFVGSWGFLEFTRSDEGTVDGFELTDELLGSTPVRFARL